MPRALIRVLLFVIPLILFVLPWSELVAFGPRWPTPVIVVGSALFGIALVALPGLLVLGHRPRRDHGRPGRDRAARIGDFLLGASWVLFTWSVLGEPLRLVLALAGVADPTRSRIVALAVLVVTVALLLYGCVEALRLPRIKRLDVVLPRLGAGLDGLRVVVLTDTHFGPIDRSRWSARVVEAVNALNADVVCHAGDLADGSVAERSNQVRPLARVRATLGRFYVTGNHEYFGQAPAWLDHMAELGWQPLHNQSRILTRGGDRLVIAGVNDATASASGLPGHGADFGAALAGVDPALAVLLLAHQPTQVTEAVAAGVDLQISGHTHGGQIWPFHYLVRTDQPTLSGLSRHGDRTQLYTSRGTGFWGPPLRVFAPSEITVLTLRA
jgi:predicted MPP superfamily phosphohydrolase